MSSLKAHLVDRALTFQCGTAQVTGIAYAYGSDAEAVFLRQTKENGADAATDVVVNLANSLSYLINPMHERPTKEHRDEISLPEWLVSARDAVVEIRFLTHELQARLCRLHTWDIYGPELVLENEDGAQEHVLWKNLQWLSVKRQLATATKAAAQAGAKDDEPEDEGSGGRSVLVPPSPEDDGSIALDEPAPEADPQEVEKPVGV